jgi:hypothetical protein
MFYTGQRVTGGLPTGLGNESGLIAGSPGYFLSDREVQNRLYRYGMDNNPAGRAVKERIEQKLQKPFLGLTPSASIPGGMPAIGNAGFFYGPQAGQVSPEVPVGFQNKYVS